MPRSRGGEILKLGKASKPTQLRMLERRENSEDQKVNSAEDDGVDNDGLVE
jgi:hypothetical protein